MQPMFHACFIRFDTCNDIRVCDCDLLIVFCFAKFVLHCGRAFGATHSTVTDDAM